MPAVRSLALALARLLPLVVAPAVPCAAGAQTGGDAVRITVAAPVPRSSQEVCEAAALPDPHWSRRPVRVEVQITDTLHTGWLESAAALADSLTDELRARVGGDGRQDGEPRVTWRAMPLSARLVARPDGSYAIVLPPTDSLAAGAAGAVELLGGGLRSLTARGALPAWPIGASYDSVIAYVRLTSATPASPRDPRDRMELLMTARSAGPLFTIAAPLLRGPVPDRNSMQIEYPPLARRFKGVVSLSFVVDTGGRVEPATIEDLRQRDVEALAPLDHAMYMAFANAARDGLLRARFEPARMAGCATRMRVMQNFEFQH